MDRPFKTKDLYLATWLSLAAPDVPMVSRPGWDGDRPITFWQFEGDVSELVAAWRDGLDAIRDTIHK